MYSDAKPDTGAANRKQIVKKGFNEGLYKGSLSPTIGKAINATNLEKAKKKALGGLVQEV